MTKIAIVTGASSGIGKACALGLLKDGWRVALIGRRADALQATVDAAGEHKANAFAVPTDVSKEEDVTKMFAAVVAKFGRVDLLFNNAGVSIPYTLPGDMSGETWRQAVDVNLHGQFYCLSNAFKQMQTQTPQGGRIINIGVAEFEDRRSKCHRRILSMSRSFVHIKSKRDLVINQVPITTKPEVNEVLPKSLLRGVINFNSASCVEL